MIRAIFLTLVLVACARAQCTLTLIPSSAHATVTGGDGMFEVTAGVSSCPRTAVSNNPDWLTVSFGQSSNGSRSTVGYTVKPNTMGQMRTGTISVNGTLFTVTQDAANCTYAFNPTSQAVAAAGGGFTLKVDTICAWTATSTVDWIVIASGAATGAGTVNYTVPAYTGTQNRSGAIQIGGQSFPVTQLGVGCSYAISQSSFNFTSDGGSGQIDVVTAPTCTWTVQNTVTWIDVKPGPASVMFVVAPNTTPLARSAVLTLGGQRATVTQAALGIVFSAASTVNAASFAEGNLSPGEIVTIFGTGLGPAVGVSLTLTNDGQSITTSLGATRVLFDGLAAPMVYASQTQVSAIVPWSIAGSVTTKVQVEVQGVASSAVSMAVAASSPAIFTVPSKGTGTAAALNQDFSVNGAGNAAAAGSALQIFATGGGVTQPASVDGRLVGTPLPYTVLPVSAQIGGIDAQVLYAGGAPGLVSGVLQVNVLVPPGVPTGSAVPVTITVGPNSTPAGVTVAIR